MRARLLEQRAEGPFRQGEFEGVFSSPPVEDPDRRPVGLDFLPDEGGQAGESSSAGSPAAINARAMCRTGSSRVFMTGSLNASDRPLETSGPNLAGVRLARLVASSTLRRSRQSHQELLGILNNVADIVA